MYRVILQYDKSWRNFLGRRWRIVDQLGPLDDVRENCDVIRKSRNDIGLLSHKKRIVGARCNPLEILKEWQSWRRKQ